MYSVRFWTQSILRKSQLKAYPDLIVLASRAKSRIEVLVPGQAHDEIKWQS